MIYDVSFIMPVCDLTKHYFYRYLDLKKYCIVNVGDRTVRMKLLIGPGEDFYGKDLTADWPKNMVAEIVETPYLEPAQKIAYYYTQFTEEEAMSAKWHAKFDDDTATDIGRMMDYLDDEFDYKDKLYIVTELRRELHTVEHDILTEMGCKHWLDKERIIHEWEGCLVSQAGMMAILNNEKAQIYLKKRAAMRGGFGDQPVGIAMKFCKVGAIEPGLLSVWAKPTKFSMFGGPYVHIHFFLGRCEMNIRTYDFYKAMLEKQARPLNDLETRMKGRVYSFTKKSSWDNMRYLFTENNRLIDTIENLEKGMWLVYKNNKVAIILHDYGSTVFELEPTDNSATKFVGICLDNQAPMSLLTI